jgi:hypothetical protein
MTKKPKTSPAKKVKKKVSGGSPARPKAPARAKAAKTVAADPLDPFIEAAAQTLDLPIDPAWQPAVKMNLQIILRQAALFTDFVLPDEAEPAPVFTA